MLSDAELEKAIKAIIDRLDGVNRLYISKIAAQVKKIGELNASSVNRIAIMTEMGTDIQVITEQLQIATGLNTKDVFQLYQKALTETYTDKRFAEALKSQPLTQTTKDRISRYAQNVSVQTAQTMQNLSNTTALSDTYRQTVDKAVLAVSTGLGDYQSATREAIRELGYNGLQVKYASGYHRRLDTAIRQNIVDGVNQIAQNASIQMGEELGFDAYEISAHARSAPDHEPVQGRVLLKAEYEKMQAGLDFTDVDGRRYTGFRRPIGEWNCMHIPISFSTKYSVRRYTDEQLRAWREENHTGCDIGGRHYTVYQASQLMRQTETEVRRQKDAANAAKAVGDMALRKDCQKTINALAARYTQISEASGLPQQKQRMVVEGFRAVRV